MKISDKIYLIAAKTIEDCSINRGIYDLLYKKLKAFQASGVDALLSGAGSTFSTMKTKIGPYLDKYSNSVDIIQSNKTQFFNKTTGVQKIPEDLK